MGWMSTIPLNATSFFEVANSPALWLGALAVVAVIAAQSVIYYRAAMRAASEAGVTRAQTRQAVRTGAVSAIGPSLAVALIATALIALLGTPGTVVRVGLIGSAPFEAIAAKIATESQGAHLGGPDYTAEVFAVTLLAMTIAGSMWMLATLIVTPLLTRGSAKVKAVNPMVMLIIPAATLAGAFFTNALLEGTKSWLHLIVLLTSAAIMAGCLYASHRWALDWLKEWALGFAIAGAIAVAIVLPALLGSDGS